jgi:adenylate cyclase
MIRFFYNVANQAILKYNGEIYQYVGDEIVVSWPKHDGLHGAKCLRCFTAIMDKVEENATIFKNDYGVVPQFKAGIHSGDVITGEIGITKKDIVYSGDVLNATARIVSLCNQYKQKLVVSEVIYNELKNTKGYRFNYLDSPVLRGKFIKLALYSVNPA